MRRLGPAVTNTMILLLLLALLATSCAPAPSPAPTSTGVPPLPSVTIPAQQSPTMPAPSPMPSPTYAPTPHATKSAPSEWTGSWTPFQFKPGQFFKYRLMVMDGTKKEGWISLELKPAAGDEVTVEWAGAIDGSSFQWTTTTEVDEVLNPMFASMVMMTNPGAAPVIAAAMTTVFAPWYTLAFAGVGPAWRIGTGWQYTDEKGRTYSARIVSDCNEAGKAGLLARLESPESKIEACVAPDVPLALSTRIWEGNKLRYEAVMTELRMQSAQSSQKSKLEEVLIRYEVIGGFVARRDKLTIDQGGNAHLVTNFPPPERELDCKIDPASIKELETALMQARFLELRQEDYPETLCCDIPSITIAYRGHTLRIADKAIPQQLRPAIDRLNTILEDCKKL